MVFLYSLYLHKLGKAPLIEDLLGTATFTGNLPLFIEPLQGSLWEVLWSTKIVIMHFLECAAP